MSIIDRYQQIAGKIQQWKIKYPKHAHKTQILAISKQKSIHQIETLIALGQHCFGESYVQEAVPKIQALSNYLLEWHFVGRVQSNKAKIIAQWFDWVHSIDSTSTAKLLNANCKEKQMPLNVCVQVNLCQSHKKGGIMETQLESLMAYVAALPYLRLRGLMTLPDPSTNFSEQRAPFAALSLLFQNYKKRYQLDTLSMGMSSDLEAAIAEGATLVRVGKAIFGPHHQKPLE